MSKEHAYAYEAGYVDGSTHYELEHCPACKNVADLQAALAENVKLREENKRLRTVAVGYYTELLYSDDVLGQIMARKKLHELGIEVDE